MELSPKTHYVSYKLKYRDQCLVDRDREWYNKWKREEATVNKESETWFKRSRSHVLSYNLPSGILFAIWHSPFGESYCFPKP